MMIIIPIIVELRAPAMPAGAGGGMQPSSGHDMLPLHLAAERALWLQEAASVLWRTGRSRTAQAGLKDGDRR